MQYVAPCNNDEAPPAYNTRSARVEVTSQGAAATQLPPSSSRMMNPDTARGSQTTAVTQPPSSMTRDQSDALPPLTPYMSSRSNPAEQAAMRDHDPGNGPGTPQPPPRQVPDRYAPDVFDGASPDPENWLNHFSRYVTYRRLNEDEQLALFPLFLKSTALDWYDNLGDATRTEMRSLLAEFKAYFCPSELDRVLDPESLFSRVQRPQEKARDYIAHMQKLARRLPGMNEGMLRCIVVRGLRPQLKAFVLQQQPTSMGEILEAAKFAETTGIAGAGAGGGDWSELMDEVRASRSEVQQLATRVNRLTTNVVQSRSPTPDRRAASRTPPRQVTFARSPDRREPRPQETAEWTRRDQGRSFRRGQGRPAYQQRQQYGRPTFSQTPASDLTPCGRCGRQHDGICPAAQRVCYNCGRRGHIRVACRSARRPPQPSH